MDFRQARLALVALVLAVAGCTQMPTTEGTASAPTVNQQAPAGLATAQQDLAGMADPVRTATTLAWAKDYLTQNRPQDAATLLDGLGQGALSQQQLYQWLTLRAQTWMAQEHPEQALTLLQQHQSDIQGLDPQRRAKLNLLRADALALDGQLMASLRQRVQVAPMLNDDDRAYNRKLTWQALMDIPLETLEDQVQQTQGTLQGWIQLALLYRDPQANINEQVQRLQQWLQRWPDHPAAQHLPRMVQALQEAANQRPEHVAVLLPESGPLASAASAIRDGMMTGYYSALQAGNPTPELRFYDVSKGNVQDIYRQAVSDGAQFVVGPLSKDNVAKIAALGKPPVTTLALNYLDQDSRNAPIFQFGLAPEDEARQVARYTLRQGNRFAGVLYPDSDWGSRVAQAFIQAFQNGGGQISAQGIYSNDNIGATVKKLMDSARTQQAQAGFPSDPDTEYQPHPGQDMSFVFLVADPNQGRQVKPALNFHYARHLPVYSTSYIYDGKPSPRRNADLDGVRYLDMPWVLYQNSRLHQLAEQTWPNGHGRYARLFAMGVDAYRLQARLYLLRTLPNSELPGVTGTLHLDGARLVRDSDWAVFKDGKVEPLPQVSDQQQNTLDSGQSQDAAGANPQQNGLE